MLGKRALAGFTISCWGTMIGTCSSASPRSKSSGCWTQQSRGRAGRYGGRICQKRSEPPPRCPRLHHRSLDKRLFKLELEGSLTTPRSSSTTRTVSWPRQAGGDGHSQFAGSEGPPTLNVRAVSSDGFRDSKTKSVVPAAGAISLRGRSPTVIRPRDSKGSRQGNPAPHYWPRPRWGRPRAVFPGVAELRDREGVTVKYHDVLARRHPPPRRTLQRSSFKEACVPVEEGERPRKGERNGPHRSVLLVGRFAAFLRLPAPLLIPRQTADGPARGRFAAFTSSSRDRAARCSWVGALRAGTARRPRKVQSPRFVEAHCKVVKEGRRTGVPPPRGNERGPDAFLRRTPCPKTVAEGRSSYSVRRRRNYCRDPRSTVC